MPRRSVRRKPERDDLVRRLLAEGMPVTKIAVEIGVKDSTAYQIVARLKDATPPPTAKLRRCLVCGEMRESTGPGDRYHDECRRHVSSIGVA